MQNSQQKTDHFNIHRLLLIHFVVCSIGLLGVVDNLARLIGPAIFSPINAFISYTDWAVFSTTATKPVELLQYGLSVPALALYYLTVLLLTRKCADSVNIVLERIKLTKAMLIGYLGLSIILNIGLLKIHGRFAPFFMLAWVVNIAMPMIPLVNAWLNRIEKRNDSWVSVVVLTALVASLGLSFYPYIKGGLPVSNDYMDIPEQTILSTGVVDNAGYINQNNIGGLYKHDPRLLSSESLLASETFIRLKKNVELLRFASNHSDTFTYDDVNNVLIVTGVMSDKNVDDLARILENEEERAGLYDFYSKQLAKLKIKKSYSAEQIEFVRKNSLEFQNQALAGHYFHHQNTMLGTINEYVLGKPQSQTVFLYGWLSTVVIAEAMKAFGGITYESYQQIFYSFYPAYYLLLLVAATIIFKRKAYVLLVGVLSIGSLYLIGFETIRFAPGFNPIRHFFDIFALVCFYWYLFKPRRKLLYFAAALMFSLLGFLFSREFGLVLLLSIVATVAVRMVVERKNAVLEFIFIAAVIFACLAFALLMPTGGNPTFLYVLLGVAAPTIYWMKMYVLLLIFSSGYVLFIKNRKPDNNWCYLSLLWFFYAQGLLIYYIWNPEPSHLWSLGTVWGMSLALLLRYCSVNFDWAALHEKKILLASNFVLTIFIFLPGIGAYYLDQHDYQSVFKDHIVHKWNFPRAKFTSTMAPEGFGNAVELIDKYSNGNSIYLLSKYDNFLPFLSAKYSAMPYPEVALSLVSKKEMDASVNLIRNNLPEYLFVDSDMTRNRQGDIFKKDDPVTAYLDVHETSKGRVMVLDNFAKVFNEISPLYESIEVGQLITVYKRRKGP